MSLMKLRKRLFSKIKHQPIYKILQRSTAAHTLDFKLIAFLKRLDSIFAPYIWWWNIRKILPSIKVKDIYQALHTLSMLNLFIVGRLAGTGQTGNGLSQYLTIVQYARQTSMRNINTLEIGTLFGGSCLTQLYARRNLGRSGIAFCIDPMNGYYGQEYDPSSNVKVNSKTFYTNIKIFSFSEQDVKLITESSHSPKATKGLIDKYFASLFIDGDHTYKGVKSDWEHYNRYVADYGFVLFDDYYPSPHLEVKIFVDQLLESLPPGWKAIGKIGATFILQRIPTQL